MAVPIACAVPPSTWPRSCAGLSTVPASTACTERRMRTSPVAGSTATRNACTLNARERRAPSSCAAADRPSGPTSSAIGTATPPSTSASGVSANASAAIPVRAAAASRSRSASAVAARCTAFPATTVPRNRTRPCRSG
ncbi:hypothetical protein BC477_12050 [Clavibacter michiganensis subsp. michiganensis]|uniref:Uncharacterized protein n=1 Tax=Clavibacter michiganensis subsp. michiganensis TaxID=33013 RepID=A0A251XH87_CLAMM|nr:hypothetical protein BC477_12050 [Clavibacter michiganensis subsp. michiganensis]OUE02528.1 hypothetical protein CMMCAS07_10960 [Clavibacter michiganensis subsp. michiganensis]